MNITCYTSNISGFRAFFDCMQPYIADQKKRIGIIDWWWTTEEQAEIQNLKKFVESHDICFFISEEIFDGHHSVDMNKVFEMLNSHNVYYLLFSHDFTLKVQPSYNRSFYNPWFFKSPLYVPTTFTPDLDYVDKTYAFNLMLGSKKSYRTIAYNVLKNNKNVYSKYLGHSNFKYDSIPNLDDIEIYTDLFSQDVDQHKLNTMNFVERCGEKYPLSHLVPEKIYANTHFDIVTETFVKYQNMFTTEKTAKPLATGRFFCWFNSNNVISHLEKYGFDFMHYHADYDKMHNDVDRLNSMLELVEEISANPLFVKDIYEKSKHARIHNMEVYKEQRKNFNSRVSDWLLLCISN